MSGNETGVPERARQKRTARIRTAKAAAQESAAEGAADRGMALEIVPEHYDMATWQRVLQDTLGVEDPALADLLLSQLANQFESGKAGDDDAKGRDVSAVLNGALAAVAGIAPSSTTEAMLAVQMVACHSMAMEMNRRARHADAPHIVSNYAHLAGKFMRLYIDQMGRLSRGRGGAQQTVRVERVTIASGGQAIVGAVAASRAVPTESGKP